MNAPNHPAASTPSPLGVSRGMPVASEASLPVSITADASKVSGRDFLDSITGRSPAIRAAEREQMIRQCIRAIERGDTYGFPPAMVAECREIMASEDSGWLLAERCALGMGGKS